MSKIETTSPENVTSHRKSYWEEPLPFNKDELPQDEGDFPWDRVETPEEMRRLEQELEIITRELLGEDYENCYCP